MLHELTASVRRWAGLPISESDPRLVRVGAEPKDAVAVAHNDLESLRGVSAASADQAPCTCPDSCERDHANE